MILLDKIKKELLQEEINAVYNREADFFEMTRNIGECNTVENIIDYLQHTGSGSREEAIGYVNYLLFEEYELN